ncbi:MAG: endo-1,4-beta-xylanase [Phycisphaerae bacterium]|nr:endo-1,4-beta-xylanase [Phycisphaerae bacterium]
MIRYKVFHNGLAPKQFPVVSTYLFGQDDIPVRSQVDYAEGELLGLRHSDSPVGLVTLWEVKDFGKLMLRTTRLPEKKKSYNLNVEIARGKLLRISQKREEWSMADLVISEELHQLIDAALDKFIDALCYLDKPAKASKLADESLTFALRAGEAMALSHANVYLEQRKKTQGFGRHCFGGCLDPSRIKDPTYQKYIKEHFHFVTIPVTWKQLEPKEHERQFELLDECVSFLSRNRIAIKIGPLLNFTPDAVPDWLYIWENDFEQVRDMAYDYITSVVERYGKKVQAWDVVSGMNVENSFQFSFEQIIEMSRSACLAAKHASPRSLILIEISEPWGDYYARNQRTIPPLIYLDMVCQSGVNFDGAGIKMHFGRALESMQSRDLLEIASLLDRFSIFGKPIHLSAVGVPSKLDKRDSVEKCGEAGYWHGPWSEQSQANWLEQVYRISMGRPFIETITWQDIADKPDGILQHGGLVDAKLKPKQAFERITQLKDELIGTNHGRKSGSASPPLSEE